MLRRASLCFCLLLASLTPARADDAGPLAIDVGHTLASPGATSASGAKEFQLNLGLARHIRAALAAQGAHEVVMVNEDGRIGGLLARPAAAAAAGSRLLLSIHHDSAQPRYLRERTIGGQKRLYTDRFHGFSLFVSAKSAQYGESVRFARLLGAALLAQGMTPTLHHAEPIPGEGRTLLDPQIGLYRFDDLVVLRHAQMPAVLLEAGVILNPADEERVTAPEGRQQIAQAVAEALDAWGSGARADEASGPAEAVGQGPPLPPDWPPARGNGHAVAAVQQPAPVAGPTVAPGPQ